MSIFKVIWRHFWGNLLKFPENVKIIQYCSSLFIRVLKRTQGLVVAGGGEGLEAARRERRERRGLLVELARHVPRRAAEPRQPSERGFLGLFAAE